MNTYCCISSTDLHNERVQNFVAGGTAMTEVKEDALEHRLLEEELDLQLSLLEEHVPDPTLFPQVVEEVGTMEPLPHLKDHTPTAEAVEKVHEQQLTMALEESVLEESNLEAATICLAIGALFVLPQLLHV